MERERGNMVLFIVFVGSLRDTTLVTTLLPWYTSLYFPRKKKRRQRDLWGTSKSR